jgi:hypothetical protein
MSKSPLRISAATEQLAGVLMLRRPSLACEVTTIFRRSAKENFISANFSQEYLANKNDYLQFYIQINASYYHLHLGGFD